MTFIEFQQQASRLACNNFGASEHLALARGLSDWRGEPPPYFRKIKAAFLSTFTIKGLPEIFKARGVFHNLFAEVYLAPYDQIGQEILNEQSSLHSFKPDIVFLITETPMVCRVHFRVRQKFTNGRKNLAIVAEHPFNV